MDNELENPLRHARVMIVDDDVRYLRGITRLLVRRGVMVIPFESPTAACSVLETESFDVLVSDVRMPEMAGDALVERLRSVRPGVPAILVSGNWDTLSGPCAGDRSAVARVDKLDGFAALWAAIGRALDWQQGA